jgi:group I intron endonuclease
MRHEYNGHSERSGIYCIKNTVNDRIYFGSAKRFKQRLAEHEVSLRNNRHANRFLQSDFNKCGTDAFVFVVVEVVDGDRDQRLAREQHYLAQFHDNGNRCYNLRRDAVSRDGAPDRDPEIARARRSAGIKSAWNAKTPEARAQHRESLQRFYVEHPDARAAVAATSKARHADPEYAAKVSAAGRKQSPEHIAKRVAAARAAGAYTQSEERRARVGAMRRRKFPPMVITGPDGTKYMTSDLRAFASEHGLRYRSLYESYRMRRCVISGWHIEVAE